MEKKRLRRKVIKFLIAGFIAAIVNWLLMFYLIEGWGFNTPLLKNVANIISIELSLIFGFFIYRIWVWPGGIWHIREVIGRQLPLYHVAAGTAVAVRILILFPGLDWLGIHYIINTFIGILLSAALNYLFSDRLIARTRPQHLQHRPQAQPFSEEIHHPEGLAPALLMKPRQAPRSHAKKSGKLDLLSIVIPAYNEESCIAPTVQSISHLLEQKKINYEILVVNDNSRDRTEELLQQLSAQNSQVRYINNYYPNGFGFAVRCGLENFQGNAVAVVMADSSDAPENIVDYYDKLQEGYDCVFGSRFISGGKAIDYPIHKLIVNRLANLFIQILFGLKFNDITNAFKIYRREVIDGISPLISHHFNLTVEMPLKAIARGYSYAVIPITWRNRAAGVSKLKLKEMGSRYLFIVLYIFLEKALARGDYVHEQPQLAMETKT